MSDPLLIGLVSTIVGGSILGLLGAIAKFTKNAVNREMIAHLRSQNFVTQDELDNTKTEILRSQDFVTPEILSRTIESKLSAFASSQDSIGIKSGKEKFQHFKGNDCEVPDVDYYMDKKAPPYRDKRIYFNQDKSQYFKETPNIVLGISLLDSEQHVISTNVRIQVTASDINKESFKLIVKTWIWSYIHKVEVDWLAYGIKK